MLLSMSCYPFNGKESKYLLEAWYSGGGGGGEEMLVNEEWVLGVCSWPRSTCVYEAEENGEVVVLMPVSMPTFYE